MSASEFESDRRGLMAAALGAWTIAAVSAVAAPAAKTPSTIRKAPPPRGSFGIVQPGLKRTAFVNTPVTSASEFKDRWIATTAPALRKRGARSIVFNLIDKEHSPEKRFDAVVEMVFD